MIFNQVKAGIKKEFLFIWRGFRLGGIALAFFASLCLIFTNGLPDDAVMYPIIATTCAGVGVFTALILLYGAAGREQTKRAIIIPRTAGLTPAGYILPKFILYPFLIFMFTFVSAILSGALVMAGTRGEGLSVGVVLITGALLGVQSMNYIFLFLFFGISTAAPGISVLLVYVVEILMSSVADALGVDKYFPHTLTNFATVMVEFHGAPLPDGFIGQAAVTVALALFSCAALMLLTLFVIVAKKNDNTADEIY